MDRSTLARKKVTVLGLARSGVAAAQLLRTAGAQVTVADAKEESALSDALAELDRREIRVVAGPQYERALAGAELVVISPGVPSGLPAVREAGRQGIPIIGELELASWFLP